MRRNVDFSEVKNFKPKTCIMSNTEKKRIWQLLLILNAILMGIAVVFLILLYIDKPHIGYVDEDRIMKKYGNIKREKEFRMFEPVPALIAEDGVDAFRDVHNYGDYFITYDTMVIKEFINIVSKQIRDLNKPLSNNDSCWQVGFYPYIKDIDPSGSYDLKLDFLAVPVIVPKNSTSADYRQWGRQGGALDYFKKIKNPYNKNFIKPYDFGNMHP